MIEQIKKIRFCNIDGGGWAGASEIRLCLESDKRKDLLLSELSITAHLTAVLNPKMLQKNER